MQFKKEEDKELFFALHPALIWIFSDLYFYAHEKHNIELVVTSTVSSPYEDKLLKRTSTSHLNRIALDIRANNLEAKITNDLVDYINKKDEYKRFHYRSYAGASRLAYYHGRGGNAHIHLALHKRYSLEPLFKQ